MRLLHGLISSNEDKGKRFIQEEPRARPLWKYQHDRSKPI